MATNTSAKAGRKEALRSAACRSGRRAISPGCGCGAEVGGRRGGGGNRWCLWCCRLRLRPRCGAARQVSLCTGQRITLPPPRPRPGPGRTDTILHARFAFPAAAQELATAPTIAGGERGHSGDTASEYEVWSPACCEQMHGAVSVHTEYSHPSCAEPSVAVVRTLHW